ncbi:MAG: DUF2383 domain-containing protein [Salipiger marinus]|uniref:DUF2383 domain-containing protein n=1 Tax=Salipiger marinus TaxID=555512 RepID=UPI0040581031
MTDPRAITATPDQLERLQHLLSRSADARAWFEEMEDRAEPEFRPVTVKFRGLHVEQVDRLTALLTAVGGEPDPSGSVRGAVSRAAVSMRAIFGEIDTDMLSAIRDSESALLDEFAAVIPQMEPSRYRDELVQMQGELTRLLAEVEAEAVRPRD